jgi:hypothetical protein
MMEAVRTSETPIFFNETTRFYIPEGRLSSPHLHAFRRENLKSREISSSHGGEYDVQSCLLGYTAV